MPLRWIVPLTILIAVLFSGIAIVSAGISAMRNFAANSDKIEFDKHFKSAAKNLFRVAVIAYIIFFRMDLYLWYFLKIFPLLFIFMLIPMLITVSKIAAKNNNFLAWEVSFWLASIIPITYITSLLFK